MEKSHFTIAVTLTWSKILALIALCMAFVLEMWKYDDGDGKVFLVALPIIAGMIITKQTTDTVKEVKSINNGT